MDPRLFEVAITGNVNYLQQLLRDNPLIFNTVGSMSAENPLHVAAAMGHSDFVREIIRLKPEFATELNEDGFCAVHLAAANGHVDAVREMMSYDRSLCLLPGKDRKTPLHFAAAKGKVGAIDAILFACCECIEAVTDRGETALHLAVKNNKFEAVEVMVDRIRENNKLEILNLKDEKGNTILHLAVGNRLRQVLGLLLGDGKPSSSLLDVNVVNHSGLTPLDTLKIFLSEAGDCEIMEILQDAGAKRARDIAHSNISPDNQTSINTSTSSNPRRQSPSKELIEYFKFKRGRDSPSEARGTLLLVASLVATTTFQFGISPPGNVWQDSYLPNESNQTSNSAYNSAHNAGEAVWGNTNPIAFIIFMFFNSVGHYVSMYMINILTSRFPLQLELQMCLFALYSTYSTVLTNITPGGIRLYTILIVSILPSVTPLTRWIFMAIRQDLVKLWKLVVKSFGRNTLA